jgi:ABC-type uncharacterized transport system substrate-binding protein
VTTRRTFVTLLGGAVAWPLAARAQPVKLPIIGFLGASTPSVMGQWTASFVQRLRELGWIEGRTIAIEVHWAEGRSDRDTEIATEFVRLKVDVIVTSSAAPVLAAKQATSNIPIVFAAAVDPLGSKLVASLARPGGKHYRPVASTDRCCGQTTGTLARGCTGGRPVGDHGQRR